MKNRIIGSVLGLVVCLWTKGLSAEENSKDATTHYQQAQELIKKGQDDKAISEASLAIKLKPNYWEAYSLRGIACARKQEFDKAIADLSEAIRLNPTNVDGYKNRAMAYAMKGDKAKALADQETVNKMLAK